MPIPPGSYTISLYSTYTWPAPGTHNGARLVGVKDDGTWMVADIVGNGDHPGDLDGFWGDTVAGAQQVVVDSVDDAYTEAHFGFFVGLLSAGHVPYAGYCWQRSGDKIIQFINWGIPGSPLFTRIIIDPLSDPFLFSGTQWGNTLVTNLGDKWFTYMFEDSANVDYLMMWEAQPDPTITEQTATLIASRALTTIQGIFDIGMTPNFLYTLKNKDTVERRDRDNLDVVASFSLPNNNFWKMEVVDDDTIFLLENDDPLGANDIKFRALNNLGSLVTLGTSTETFTYAQTLSFHAKSLPPGPTWFFYAMDAGADVPVYIYQLGITFESTPPPKGWCV